MRRVAVAGALLLSACGQRSQPSQSNVVAGTPPKVAIETAGANSAANVAANETGVLPPANAAMRYVGTWAKTKADCASKPWHFTTKSLRAKDGPQCSFYNVAKAPAAMTSRRSARPSSRSIPTS